MPSLLVTATGQALVLGVASNVLAQIISAQQEGRPFAFDWQIFAFFLVFTLISTPPNVLWQISLEEKFPGNDVDDKGQKTFSKINTVKKFVLDQTISASLNTIGYIAALSAYQGNDTAGILNDVQNDFWPLMRAGWKVWPLVALLSFTVIPLEKRTLFGSTVGLFWGIYMSLLATDKAK